MRQSYSAAEKGGDTVTRILSFLILSGLFAGTALADTPPASESTRKNSLAPGSWAIQFQVADDIGLRPFNGMSVSLKRHTSARSAFRLAVTLDLRSEDGDSESADFQADEMKAAEFGEASENSQSGRIDLLCLRYPAPMRGVNWFWGAGPLFRFSRVDHDEKNTETLNERTLQMNSSRLTRSWGIGVLGTLGVEWFATHDVSFHAEYFASCEYASERTEYQLCTEGPSGTTPTHRNTETSEDRWLFDGANAVFGVSLYF
jgi:hypothetical protein